MPCRNNILEGKESGNVNSDFFLYGRILNLFQFNLLVVCGEFPEWAQVPLYVV